MERDANTPGLFQKGCTGRFWVIFKFLVFIYLLFCLSLNFPYCCVKFPHQLLGKHKAQLTQNMHNYVDYCKQHVRHLPTLNL